MDNILNQIIELVRDCGFKANLNFDNSRIVDVRNDKDELIGQLVPYKEDKMWFSVFDTTVGRITVEGGECSYNKKSVESIIDFFSYR